MELVGREGMIEEVIHRLGQSRLVTITGPGGIGKTALADAVARQEGHLYPLGCHRVDLTIVDGEDGVASALAAQLGFGSFRSLLDSPTEQPALVVIDNCEHVLDAASEAVFALLDACRSPRVLATSRSPLGLGGESVVVLGPLELPVGDGGERNAAAVQLFLQRAREAGTAVADRELASVAQICELLDGLPLAIELAAARSRVLSPTELLDRLGDLDTLRRSRGRGPVRHRSLRDTIAWSYELLDAEDRRFFDRLAVLSGPFTTDDAHAVAGDDEPATTIDRLDRLSADSLLTTTVIAGVAYHRLLVLVRSYARERLVAAGEWDATWQRFVDRVTQRSIQLITDSGSGWDRSSLATLLSRVEQHLTVLRWCVERDDRPARSFILVSTLWGVIHQGRLTEIEPLAERVLERWDDSALPGWADAAATTATCRYLSGRPHDAIDLASLALEHADAAHYAPCTLRRVIAHASVALGDLTGAVEMLSEAIEIAEYRVPALAMEMTVSRAEIRATAAHAATASLDSIGDLIEEVRAVAERAGRDGLVVNEIWARTVEATLLARTNHHHARQVAGRNLIAAREAVYPAAEAVNLHTLASLLIDDGNLAAAADLTRQLIDGLVARGAQTELRNGLRLAAVILVRANRPAWETLAETADTMPVVSLFSLPGHERHALPRFDPSPTDLRMTLDIARTELDAIAQHGASSSAPPSRPPDVRIEADPTHSAEPTPNACWRAGDLWTITFDGVTVHLRASKGLADIAILLAAPDTDVHCADLAGVIVEEHASGDLIDTRARREYEQRVRDLQVEIDDAEADADYHRADRARAELDAIVDHLTAALGLGGRARRHTDGVERARSAVTQRIRSTIRRIQTVHPTLGAHLDTSVHTGVYCRYRPERPTEWSTVGPET